MSADSSSRAPSAAVRRMRVDVHGLPAEPPRTRSAVVPQVGQDPLANIESAADVERDVVAVVEDIHPGR